MKGRPAGALGHTTQWRNSCWPKQQKSAARRAEGEGQRVGAGWWWGGQCFGASSVRARLFGGSEQSHPLHSHPEMQIALHQSFTLSLQQTKCKCWLLG